MKNLYLRAYEAANNLDETNQELAALLRELDKNRMELIRMIENITDDPGIYDFPTLSYTWLESASELVFASRNNRK